MKKKLLTFLGFLITGAITAALEMWSVKMTVDEVMEDTFGEDWAHAIEARKWRKRK